MEFIGGLLSGIGISLGLGGSTILTLFLTFFLGVEQYSAQYISLLSYFPASFISFVYNFKKGNIHFKNCMIIISFGILGAITGSLISAKINVFFLRKTFGFFLLIAVLFELKNLFILIRNKKIK